MFLKYFYHFYFFLWNVLYKIFLSLEIEIFLYALLNAKLFYSNPRVPCNAIGTVNLELWRDTSTCLIGSRTVFIGSSSSPSPCTVCQCTSTGAQCSTRRVNCFEIRAQFSLDEILRDEVCRTQCGNILDPNRPTQQPHQRPSTLSHPPTPPNHPSFANSLRPPPPHPAFQQGFQLNPSNRPLLSPPPPNSGPFRPSLSTGNNTPLRSLFPIPNFLRNLFS